MMMKMAVVQRNCECDCECDCDYSSGTAQHACCWMQKPRSCARAEKRNAGARASGLKLAQTFAMFRIYCCVPVPSHFAEVECNMKSAHTTLFNQDNQNRVSKQSPTTKRALMAAAIAVLVRNTRGLQTTETNTIRNPPTTWAAAERARTHN